MTMTTTTRRLRRRTDEGNDVISPPNLSPLSLDAIGSTEEEEGGEGNVDAALDVDPAAAAPVDDPSGEDATTDETEENFEEQVVDPPASVVVAAAGGGGAGETIDVADAYPPPPPPPLSVVEDETEKVAMEGVETNDLTGEDENGPPIVPIVTSSAPSVDGVDGDSDGEMANNKAPQIILPGVVSAPQGGDSDEDVIAIVGVDFGGGDEAIALDPTVGLEEEGEALASPPSETLEPPADDVDFIAEEMPEEEDQQQQQDQAATGQDQDQALQDQGSDVAMEEATEDPGVPDPGVVIDIESGGIGDGAGPPPLTPTGDGTEQIEVEVGTVETQDEGEDAAADLADGDVTGAAVSPPMQVLLPNPPSPPPQEETIPPEDGADDNAAVAEAVPETVAVAESSPETEANETEEASWAPPIETTADPGAASPETEALPDAHENGAEEAWVPDETIAQEARAKDASMETGTEVSPEAKGLPEAEPNETEGVWVPTETTGEGEVPPPPSENADGSATEVVPGAEGLPSTEAGEAQEAWVPTETKAEAIKAEDPLMPPPPPPSPSEESGVAGQDEGVAPEPDLPSGLDVGAAAEVTMDETGTKEKPVVGDGVGADGGVAQSEEGVPSPEAATAAGEEGEQIKSGSPMEEVDEDTSSPPDFNGVNNGEEAGVASSAAETEEEAYPAVEIGAGDDADLLSPSDEEVDGEKEDPVGNLAMAEGTDAAEILDNNGDASLGVEDGAAQSFGGTDGGGNDAPTTEGAPLSETEEDQILIQEQHQDADDSLADAVNQIEGKMDGEVDPEGVSDGPDLPENAPSDPVLPVGGSDGDAAGEETVVPPGLTEGEGGENTSKNPGSTTITGGDVTAAFTPEDEVGAVDELGDDSGNQSIEGGAGDVIEPEGVDNGAAVDPSEPNNGGGGSAVEEQTFPAEEAAIGVGAEESEGSSAVGTSSDPQDFEGTADPSEDNLKSNGLDGDDLDTLEPVPEESKGNLESTAVMGGREEKPSYPSPDHDDATACPPLFGEGSTSFLSTTKCFVGSTVASHPLASSLSILILFVLCYCRCRRWVSALVGGRRPRDDKRGEYAAVSAEYDDFLRRTFDDEISFRGPAADDDGSDDSVDSNNSSWGNGAPNVKGGLELGGMEADEENGGLTLEEVNG